MANKKSTLTYLIAVLLAAIGGWELAIFSGQASERVAAMASQVTPASRFSIFEYKILNVPFSQAFSRTSGPASAPFLEVEINKLSGQGFVVESFQRGATVFGNGTRGGFTIGTSSEFVVLLKKELR